jgi:hypothetical protein
MAALNNFAQLLPARTEELTDLGKEEFLRFGNHRSLVSDIRAIGESEGHKRGQGQLLGTLRTAQDSREIRQNPTNNEHDHRNIEHFSSDILSLCS